MLRKSSPDAIDFKVGAGIADEDLSELTKLSVLTPSDSMPAIAASKPLSIASESTSIPAKV